MPKNRKPRPHTKQRAVLNALAYFRPHADAPSPHTSARVHIPTIPPTDSWDALDAQLDALGISYQCTTFLVDSKTGKVSVESVHTKVQL